MTGVTDDVLLVERRGHVLILTLNRPGSRNAIDTALADALGAALDDFAAEDGLRVAVLTGAGPSFCAGQDLKEFARTGSISFGSRPEWGFAGTVRHAIDKPVIAAVHGLAFGGGLELALAADLVVAAAGTRLGLPEVTRGLFAAGGGVPRVVQQLPFKLGLQLLLTGQPVLAELAAQWGLVNEVVPEGEHLDRAIALAETIAANAPLAVQATKRLAYAGVNESTWAPGIWEPIDREYDAVFRSEDAAEGARAFVEKRPPVWRSR